MNRFSSGALVAVVGAVVLGAVIRGDHLAYVKDSLSIPLVISAVLAIAVGLHECVAAGRASTPAAEVASATDSRFQPGLATTSCGLPAGAAPASGAHAHTDGDHAHPVTGGTDGHGHSHHGWGPAVGWALLAPFLVLSSLPPTPAGAYAATRTSDTSIAASAGSRPEVDYPELPAGQVNEMRLREYWMRAHFAPDGLKDRTIRLTGFAAADPAAGQAGWMLTRMAIQCCAADAFPVRVRLVEAPAPAPAANSWVTLEGTWVADPLLKGAPSDSEGLTRPPVLKVTKVTATTQPTNPYE